jgi:hypothetical protein
VSGALPPHDIRSRRSPHNQCPSTPAGRELEYVPGLAKRWYE